MSEPQNNNHDVTIALHGDRLNRFERSLEAISKSLEALTRLEIHHSETRGLMNAMTSRCDRVERLIDAMDERIEKVEDIEKTRAGMLKAIGFIWAAIGGLVMIELWRFIGGTP